MSLGLNQITTATGRQFAPLAPRAEDISLKDIGIALPRINRFNGHTRWTYSVAQHSLLVSAHCPPELAAWGLLHDVAEIYTSDIPTPVKRGIVGFDEIEQRILQCVAERFALVWPIPPELWDIDRNALATEWRDLMPSPERAAEFGEPFSDAIQRIQEPDVRERFRIRCEKLEIE